MTKNIKDVETGTLQNYADLQTLTYSDIDQQASSE